MEWTTHSGLTTGGNHSTTNLPHFYPLEYRVFACILVTLIFLVGSIGNLLVIAVVLGTRSMHTPTNCYLVSLACADIILLVSAALPTLVELFYAVDQTLLGTAGCALMVFSQYLGVNVSSLSITAFTVERYIAIGHPMRARSICTVNRAGKIILTLWVCCTLYCSPWLGLITARATTYSDGTTIERCAFRLPRGHYTTFYLADFIIFYVVPLLVTCILYGLIGRALYRSQSDAGLRRTNGGMGGASGAQGGAATRVGAAVVWGGAALGRSENAAARVLAVEGGASKQGGSTTGPGGGGEARTRGGGVYNSERGTARVEGATSSIDGSTVRARGVEDTIRYETHISHQGSVPPNKTKAAAAKEAATTAAVAVSAAAVTATAVAAAESATAAAAANKTVTATVAEASAAAVSLTEARTPRAVLAATMTSEPGENTPLVAIATRNINKTSAVSRCHSDAVTSQKTVNGKENGVRRNGKRFVLLQTPPQSGDVPHPGSRTSFELNMTSLDRRKHCKITRNGYNAVSCQSFSAPPSRPCRGGACQYMIASPPWTDSGEGRNRKTEVDRFELENFELGRKHSASSSSYKNSPVVTNIESKSRSHMTISHRNRSKKSMSPPEYPDRSITIVKRLSSTNGSPFCAINRSTQDESRSVIRTHSALSSDRQGTRRGGASVGRASPSVGVANTPAYCQQQSKESSKSFQSSRVQVVKMLAVVVVVFAVLWLPYRAYVVYNSFARWRYENVWFLLACRLMVYINSAINPILYNAMSAKFRRSFLNFLACRRRPGPPTSSWRQTMIEGRQAATSRGQVHGGRDRNLGRGFREPSHSRVGLETVGVSVGHV